MAAFTKIGPADPISLEAASKPAAIIAIILDLLPWIDGFELYCYNIIVKEAIKYLIRRYNGQQNIN